MELRSLIDKAYIAAVDKGFYDKELEIGELLMMLTQEVAEAYDAYRYGNKDEFSLEMADVQIIFASICGHLGLDLPHWVNVKMEMDKKREHKHGRMF